MERPFSKKKRGFLARLTEEIEEPLVVIESCDFDTVCPPSEEEIIAMEKKRASQAIIIGQQAIGFNSPWDRHIA